MEVQRKMKCLKRNKGDGLVSVVLALVIGAAFGAYIIGVILGGLNMTTLPVGFNTTITGIGTQGLTALGVVALAALVVVVGYIMKAI